MRLGYMCSITTHTHTRAGTGCAKVRLSSGALASQHVSANWASSLRAQLPGNLEQGACPLPGLEQVALSHMGTGRQPFSLLPTGSNGNLFGAWHAG